MGSFAASAIRGLNRPGMRWLLRLTLRGVALAGKLQQTLRRPAAGTRS